MRQQFGLVCLLLLFISEYQAQDPTIQPTPPPDWNGDPNLCTVIPAPTPSSLPLPPFPKFGPQAEFTIERIEQYHLLDIPLPSVLTMYEYVYDYDANKLIMVKNANGFIDVEYYYYNILKKATYYRGDFCVVTDIPTNADMDGASAIQLPNSTWHIRPLPGFLLFSTEGLNQPIYMGQEMIRGIPTDKWQSCYINKTELRTVRRIWHFAQQNVSMPTGPVDEYAVPVQALISGSYSLPNGTQVVEVNEIYNVLSYRRGIMESAAALSPPKGVFCSSGTGQNLVSLSDAGVSWPNRFSVRVETSTSYSSRWQRFHLRYDQGRDGGSRRLRYDYMPVGSEDFESVIHDYTDDLTYVIDRRVGTCRITRGTEIRDVSPIRDPIQFFIKNEARFIFNPPTKAWESNGVRLCRANNIQCTILTTSIDKFPAMVDSDTGALTGETWEATNVEYGWSMRAPYNRPPPDAMKQFDYPVSLYLKMYRYQDPSNPSAFGIRTEDIEYEFYEMSHDRQPDDFDTSICYRSLNYEYLHLFFTLKLNRGNIIDGNHLNRRVLERHIYGRIMNITQVRFSRIADLEIDHERATNDVTVFFTLLGPTPKPESTSGVDDTEPTAAHAFNDLTNGIRAGQFQFTMRLDDDSETQFQAISGSLKGSKQFTSTHTVGNQIITESYKTSSQNIAIIFGLLVGILLGVIIVAVVRIVRKEPMPSLPGPISNPLPSINFHSKKSAEATTSNA